MYISRYLFILLPLFLSQGIYLFLSSASFSIFSYLFLSLVICFFLKVSVSMFCLFLISWRCAFWSFRIENKCSVNRARAILNRSKISSDKLQQIRKIEFLHQSCRFHDRKDVFNQLPIRTRLLSISGLIGIHSLRRM